MPRRLADLFDDADVLQWSGNLLGDGAQTVLPVPGSDDSIVLVPLSVSSHVSFRNLMRVSKDGSIIWRAGLPTDRDSYVSVKWLGALVFATSWNGYSVEIAADSGRLMQVVFTK